MRAYAQIVATFWTRGSGKKLRGDPVAQVLALYLMTAPSSNMVGLFYLPLPTICHETGLTEEEVRETLPKLSEILEYDEAESLVWVPRAAHYQFGPVMSDKDKRRPAVIRDLEAVGDHPFGHAFRALYGIPYSIPPSPFRQPEKGLPESQKPPVPVLAPVLDRVPVLAPDSDARDPLETGGKVRYPAGLDLSPDERSTALLNMGISNQTIDAIRTKLELRYTKSGETKPLGAWLGILKVAVVQDGVAQERRNKPPGFVDHEARKDDPEGSRIERNTRHDHLAWLLKTSLNGDHGAGAQKLAEAGNIEELDRRYELAKQRKQRRREDSEPVPLGAAIAATLAQPARKANAGGNR